MNWKPIHKRTAQEYPIVSDAERQRNWSRPPYSTNWNFEPVGETEKPTGVKPLEKKIETSQEEKGLDQPNG